MNSRHDSELAQNLRSYMLHEFIGARQKLVKQTLQMFGGCCTIFRHRPWVELLVKYPLMLSPFIAVTVKPHISVPAHADHRGIFLQILRREKELMYSQIHKHCLMGSIAYLVLIKKRAESKGAIPIRIYRSPLLEQVLSCFQRVHNYVAPIEDRE